MNRESSSRLKTLRGIEKSDSKQGQKSYTYKFQCQCGKEYISYSAIYLHFKRNHKLKITTKLQEQNCKITEQGRVKRFTYYYSKKLQQAHLLQINMFKNFQSGQQNKQIIDSVINQYISLIKYNTKTTTNQWFYWIFKELGKFIIEERIPYQQRQIIKMSQDLNENNKEIIKQIPNYLNKFVQNIYQYLVRHQLFEEVCLQLLEFANWLRQNNYTEYILELNKVQISQQVIIQSSSSF